MHQECTYLTRRVISSLAYTHQWDRTQPQYRQLPPQSKSLQRRARALSRLQLSRQETEDQSCRFGANNPALIMKMGNGCLWALCVLCACQVCVRMYVCVRACVLVWACVCECENLLQISTCTIELQRRHETHVAWALLLPRLLNRPGSSKRVHEDDTEAVAQAQESFTIVAVNVFL